MQVRGPPLLFLLLLAPGLASLCATRLVFFALVAPALLATHMFSFAKNRWMQLLITGSHLHTMFDIVDYALSFFITLPTGRHLDAFFDIIDYPLILFVHFLQWRRVHALFQTFLYPLFVSTDFHTGQLDS